MAKVIFIIAKHGFRDEELLEPKKVLEGVHEVHIASTSPGECVGKLGAKVHAGLSIQQALEHLAEWSAVIFIGGPGVQTLFGDQVAHELARKAITTHSVQVLAAICWAPILLARAGVLDGKKITGWDDGMGTQHRELKKAGALLQPQHVVIDGKLITGDGPEHAKDFGKAILRILG